MADVRALFAAATAALEDAHGIAVEGQRGDLTADEQQALAMSMRAALARQNALLEQVDAKLGQP